MAFQKWINNLTAGEWSPLLDGRSDLDKYDYACRTLENVRPLPYGGGRIRGGLEYIAACKTHDTPVRLIPFNFSTGTRFVLELGDFYMRFYSNDVQVEVSGVAAWLTATPYVVGDYRTNTGTTYRCIVAHTSGTFATDLAAGKWVAQTAYELVTPFADETVFVLQVKQINDVMYLVHPSYPPQKLSRIADTNWTIADVDWTYPPLREENVTATKVAIDNAAIGTGRTLTATGGTPFVSTMVGAYFEVRHLREGDGVELSLAATGGAATQSSSLTVKGDWQVVTTERWYGVLLVERSKDAGSTWETVRKFQSSADRNVSASGSETEECLLRLNYTATGDPYGAAVWVGTATANYVKANAKLESTEAYAAGLVKVTGYTSTTVLTVTVVQTLASTAATDLWSEGAWSPYRGYPAAVGLYEQRLLFGATSEKPTRFWGSVTGDFENYAYGDDDDAALAFDIATTEGNPIKWLESLQRIQIGTGGGEYAAGSGSADEPMTPSNISVRGQSAYGSGSFQPVLVNDAVIFIQRQGRKLREMTYDIQRDGYVAPDLTLLAEHITDPTIIQLAFARQPDPLVMGSTGEHLAVMTYNREQNITAWARYTTEDGIAYFESVCSIYGDPADEVWCVVRRLINGSSKRYIERFADETDSKTTCRLLDSYKTGTLTDPFSGTISGLSHLEAKTVRLVVAGAVIGDYVVASGAITVPVANVPTLGTYVVGLPYRAIIQPMKLEIQMANGPSAGRTRKVHKLRVRFKDTGGGVKFGPDLSNLEEVIFRDAVDTMDASAPLFTGDKEVAFNGGYETSGSIVIVQDAPLPFTVIGIGATAEISAN